MTDRNAIEMKIKALEEKRFYLAMKDRWDARDYQKDNEWFAEIIELNRLLNA